MTVEEPQLQQLPWHPWHSIHGEVKTIEYDAAGNVIRYSGKNCEDASERQGKLPLTMHWPMISPLKLPIP
jgi:hypothetical protein